jgi:hypothetical protein
MPLRKEFPPAGNPSYLDGECDGWEYKISFRGSTLEKSYAMVRAFLEEEGYEDVPIPRNAEELKLFKLSARRLQLDFFQENGYIHNPIKILFPAQPRFKNTIQVCLYNEADEQHLLKFHKVIS